MGQTPPPQTDDVNRDLGLGSRLTQYRGYRLLNRDGSFNARREGLSFLRALNPFHAFMTMPWSRFFAWVAAGYFVTNGFFALLYEMCGPAALSGIHGTTPLDRFRELFFFSVQTLATIGYGVVSPVSIEANLLVTLEALIGLMGFALATGLLFARFSRPEAHILFSQKAVVAPYRGGQALMFRVINERSSQLIEVEVTVSLSRLETSGGASVRRFYPLALERSKVVFFPLHWVVVHPIDASSPLAGVTPEQFAASDAEVLILITGIEETFSQAVHARSSYKPDEVVWGARFADMFVKSEAGEPIGVDMRRFNDVERA